MGDLVVLLLPEMLGLAVTPAAVVACLLLLGSAHPLRNVGGFAGGFLGSYVVISALVLGVAGSTGAAETSSGTVRGGISVTVGVLFLAGAAVMWLRRGRARSGGPGWTTRLADPTPGQVAAVGAVLGVLNPNLVILASGLGMVVASDVAAGGRLLGAALLLAASALDFVVPTILYAATGERGRRTLAGCSRWLIAHDRVIGMGVLLGFGLLFLARGLGQLG